MARITVEDCLDNVDNRFQLVMVASKRARQLQIMGREPMVSLDNDKPTVLALREIAEGLVTRAILTEKPGIERRETPAQSVTEASDADENPEITESEEGETAEKQTASAVEANDEESESGAEEDEDSADS